MYGSYGGDVGHDVGVGVWDCRILSNNDDYFNIYSRTGTVGRIFSMHYFYYP